MQARRFWHAPRTGSTDGQRSHRRHGLARRAAVSVIAVAALLLGVLQPAQAVRVTAGVQIDIGIPGYSYVWLGGHGGPAGSQEHGYCTQAVVAAPNPTDVPLSHSVVQDPHLAHAFAHHRHSTDETTQGALGYLVHMRHARPGAVAGGDVEQTKALISAAAPAHIKTRATQLMADAAAQSGPFTGAPGTPATEDKRTGSVNGIGLKSDAGQWVAGKPITVRLDGPATFDATGTSTWTGTTASSGISLGWTATGNGTVTATVTVAALDRTTLTGFDMASNLQDLLSYGNRSVAGDPEEVTTPGPPFEVALDFQPEIRTQVASTFVGKGEPLVDQVTAAAAAGDTWTTISGTPIPVVAEGVLYGPFDSMPAQSPTVPVGAPVAATDTLTFHGPGTLDSSANLRASGSGYYTWVWTIRKTGQPTAYEKYIRADATHDFGLEAETHIVPFQPVVTTAVRDRVVEPGESFVDEWMFDAAAGDLWLSKRDGTPVPITAFGTLYGPFDVPVPEAADIPPDAPRAGWAQLSASGPGIQSTPTSNVAVGPGFYTWVVDIPRDWQPVASQPYLSGDFTTAFMIEAETATVRHTTAISTMAREYNVVIGGQAQDIITISGLPDSHGDFPGLGGWAPDVDEITHTLYGPFRSPPTDRTDLTRAAVVSSVTTPARNGQYLIGTSGEFTLWDEGFYVFVSTFPGDDRVNAFATSPGDVLEQVYVPGDKVGPPGTWLVTDADAEVVAGQPFSDTAYLTGTTVDDGYLVFEAFGVFTAADPPAEEGTDAETDAGADVHADGDGDDAPEPVRSEETLLWTSENITVAGAGTYRSGVTTAELPEGAAEGFVYWVATYYDLDDTILAEGRFGDESEITRLVPPTGLVVSTVATEETDTGGQARDTAFVSGPVEPGSHLTFSAYRQLGDEAAADDPLVVDTSDEPVIVNSAGTHRSPWATFDEPGTHYWVETFVGPEGDVLHVGDRGVPAESTAVLPPPEEAPEVPVEPEMPEAAVLPTTGAGVFFLALGAVALLGVGTVVVLAHRRRLWDELAALDPPHDGPER